eukprot:1075998_1
MADLKISFSQSRSASSKMLPTENSERITWLDRYSKASPYAKLFLIVSTVHAIVMGIVGTISLAWNEIPNIYGSLSIFVAFCFLMFMLEGVLKENTIELLCSIVSAVLVTTFLIWFYAMDHAHPIIATLAFGSTVFCGIYIVIAPCVISQFGWYRYNKSQTTNKHTMDMYYIYQKFQAMLWMDAELCIMLGLLVTFELKHQTILGWIGNIACILFEVAWVALGIRAVRTEHLLITQCFMGCTVFLLGYVITVCVWIATDQNYSASTSELQFFVLGTLALVVRALSMYWTWRVIGNFDKGLRQYFDQGGHYIDFWGQSNAKLLATDFVEHNGHRLSNGIPRNKTSTGDGTSSRSRLNSEDFD